MGTLIYALVIWAAVFALVALMRREVLIRRLALLIDADQYFAISDEVAAMSDAQVLGYKKPKLVARNIQA